MYRYSVHAYYLIPERVSLQLLEDFTSNKTSLLELTNFIYGSTVNRKQHSDS
jgi:hypothetical protein